MRSNLPRQIDIQIADARQGAVQVTPLTVVPGCTVRLALLQAGVPENELAGLSFGVYHAKRSLDDLLKAGDRIELYQPLPKNRANKVRELNRT